MPAQGGRPIAKHRFSGLRNALGISGANQSGNPSQGLTGSSGQLDDENILESLTPDELVLTKV